MKSNRNQIEIKQKYRNQIEIKQKSNITQFKTNEIK